MRKHIGWFERNADRQRREVQVRIKGGALHWDVKIDKAEHWQRDITPTRADWETLLQKMENSYRRRAASYDALELVRRLKAAEDGKQSQ